MGTLSTEHELHWVLRLREDGTASHELVDGEGRRWGWFTNASGNWWDAYVGDGGQAAELGGERVPVAERHKHFGRIALARVFIEANVAVQWREAHAAAHG